MNVCENICSFVFDVVDFLLLFQTTIIVYKSCLVEALCLIHILPVQSPCLVWVHVLLSAPICSIPQLSIRAITARKPFTLSWLHIQSFWAIKLHRLASVTPDCLWLITWISETHSGSGGRVVGRLHTFSSSLHGWFTILAACRVELVILLWNEGVVETSSCKVIFGIANNRFREDSSRLFSKCLTNVLVVGSDTWSVTCIPWNSMRLLCNLDLFTQCINLKVREFLLWLYPCHVWRCGTCYH